MSAELAIAIKAKNNTGDTVVIFKEDFDENRMTDISIKFINAGCIDDSTYKIVVMKAFNIGEVIEEPPEIDTAGWYRILFNSDTYGDYDISTIETGGWSNGIQGDIDEWGAGPDVMTDHQYMDANNNLITNGAYAYNSFKTRVVGTTLEVDRDYTNQSVDTNYRTSIEWDSNNRTWNRTDNSDYYLYPMNQSASYSSGLGVITSDPRFLTLLWHTSYNGSGIKDSFPKTAYIYLQNGESIEDV